MQFVTPTYTVWHKNVSCNKKTLTIHCYQKHPGINLTQSWNLYTNGPVGCWGCTVCFVILSSESCACCCCVLEISLSAVNGPTTIDSLSPDLWQRICTEQTIIQTQKHICSIKARLYLLAETPFTKADQHKAATTVLVLAATYARSYPFTCTDYYTTHV